MRKIFFACVIAIIPLQVLAQTPSAEDAGLATPTGHEVSVGVVGYKYVEPGDLAISIHGPKIAGEYTGTLSLNQGRHWFVETNVRGTAGNTTYDGWCFPFLIRPDRTSPNGYLLDIGDASPCSESGDTDWYVEGRALIGRDFIGRKWGWSPDVGLGVRHLSNGVTGLAGYRTDNYLYLPVGLTARTGVGAASPQSSISFNLEYDRLLRGWQTTRDSALGGGDVKATPTAPPFTINGFSDVSFDQHGGWALRASATYQVTKRWSVEPSFIHWSVSSSPVNFETVTFTVNNITAREQLGAFEPDNSTNEFGVKLGFRF